MRASCILLFLLLFTNAIGQGTQVYFEEDFNGCVPLEDWETIAEGDTHGFLMDKYNNHKSVNVRFPDEGNECFYAFIMDSEDPEYVSEDAYSASLVTPFIDLTEAVHPVLSFDYVSFSGHSFRLEYRIGEDGEWLPIPIPLSSYQLSWNTKEVILMNVANAPINEMDDLIQFKFSYSSFVTFGYYATAIDNVSIYEAKEEYAEVSNLIISDVIPTGTHDLRAAIVNKGSNTINSGYLRWQINDGPIEGMNFSEFTWHGRDEPFSYSLPFASSVSVLSNALEVTFEEEGTYEIKCWLFRVNSTEIENESPVFTKTIKVADVLPEKTYVYEKFMHNTCPPCYEKDLFLAEVLANNDNIVGVSYHNATSDPMNYHDAFAVDFIYATRTHPGALIDRNFVPVLEPYYYAHKESRLLQWSLPWWSGVNVEVVNKEYSLATGILKVEVEATFYVDYDEELRFNMYITEDNIQAYMSDAPEGNNYLHNHVLRELSGGDFGVENSLPSTNPKGSKQRYTFETVIKDEWIEDEINIIATVSKYNLDNEHRQILNASDEIDLFQVISSVESDQLQIQGKVYPNPTTDDASIVLDPIDFKAYIVQLFDSTGKLLIEKSMEKETSNFFNVSLADYKTGAYFLHITHMPSGESLHKTIIKH